MAAGTGIQERLVWLVPSRLKQTGATQRQKPRVLLLAGSGPWGIAKGIGGAVVLVVLVGGRWCCFNVTPPLNNGTSQRDPV